MLSIFTVSLSIGQLLFKRVGLTIRGRPAADGILAILREPTLYAALALYGASTILWIWILSRVALSRAYPWASAGTVIVPLLGWYVFGERIPPIFWLGVLFIIAGVALTQLAQ